MKYLECPELNELTSALTEFDVGDRTISATIEAYSCKSTHPDRKLTKEIETKFLELAKSPATTPVSPLGPLSRSSTRKLLVNLISTMNASFPDYDFSNLSPDQFEQEPNHVMVVSVINNQLLDTVEKTTAGFKSKFWKVLDEVIEIEQCEIYSFVADSESEVFTVGKLWSLNYFFFNKTMNKLVFFTCSATSKLHTEKSQQEAAKDQASWTAHDLTMVNEPVTDAAWVLRSSPLIKSSPPPLDLNALPNI